MLQTILIIHILLCVLVILIYGFIAWIFVYRYIKKDIQPENLSNELSPATLRYLYLGTIDHISVKANLLDLRNRGFIDEENRSLSVSNDPPFEDEKAMLEILKDTQNSPIYPITHTLEETLNKVIIRDRSTSYSKVIRTLLLLLLMQIFLYLVS